MSTFRFTLKLSIAVLLLVSGSAVFSKEGARIVYSQQDAADVLRQSALEVELKGLQVQNSLESRITLVRRWIDDEALEVLVKDKLLYEATLSFRDETESAEVIALMQGLTSYESAAYLPLYDAGRSIEVAVFEVAASARATLIHWQVENYFKDFSGFLGAKPDLFLQRLREIGESEVGVDKKAAMGVIKAIELADSVDVNALALQIKNSSESDLMQIPPKVLATIAFRSADVVLFRSLINHYQHHADLQADILRKLSHLPEGMLVDEKVSILLLASQKPKLADTAIFALADFQNDFSEVRQLLFNRLSDRKLGGTAALVLGDSDDLLVLNRLALNLDVQDDLLMRRSLLAIYFNYQKYHGLEARRLLEKFHASTANLQLKAEVGEWLL